MKRNSAGINETLVETAITGMLSSQRAPWEHGVAQTALLEMQAGQWSVFAGVDNGAPYRPGKLQPQSAGLSPLLVGMSYNSVRAQDRLGKLCARVTGDENAQEGSALDPAACGDGVLMAAFASGEINETTAAVQGFWIEAASDMLNYLLNIAPRTPSGAISHRSTGAVYWSGELTYNGLLAVISEQDSSPSPSLSRAPLNGATQDTFISSHPEIWK